MSGFDLAAFLLPGVPLARVRALLENAAGNELASGKFASPESSAALAVNSFGWFISRPSRFPSLPEIDTSDAVEMVDVEFIPNEPRICGGAAAFLHRPSWVESDAFAKNPHTRRRRVSKYRSLPICAFQERQP